ncbi:right-handed parallel beta-helix repeat-containing protein [Duganella callida]|uniref:Pectate lyase n=1 Tax=Duganella callida TaxID=2561932 RepID=A0A4Y9SBC6_9BURK|nr:right-handed parallel beta-helix repeat-containing protein [Duganella callida]TFW19523.1 pectate lyase [Duganella callida]
MNKFLLTALLTAACSAQSADYFVAPDGDDAGAGTLAAPWKSLARAQQAAQPGDTVYLRGGRYIYAAGENVCASRTAVVNGVTLDKSGSEDKPIRYWAYRDEMPVFDFSPMKDDCRVKGFNVTASWIHLKGIEVTGAPQQPQNRLNHESWGIWVNGSHNIFERLNLHHNMGPGLFIKDGAWNLVLNSDSHHNYDPYTSNGAGQSADGFGAHIKAGQPGNVFRGCRAWANSDDGFDLINAYSPVTIEYSWAWQQGYLPGTHTPLEAGNGNGIKAGGYGGKYVPNGVKHVVHHSVAFDNKAAGFYANHHPLAIDFFNNTAFANGADYNMLGIAADGAAVNLDNLRDNIAYKGKLTVHTEGLEMAHNSWTLSSPPTDADFEDVSDAGWDAPRQADGSLPVLRSYHVRSGSPLAGMGAF